MTDELEGFSNRKKTDAKATLEDNCTIAKTYYNVPFLVKDVLALKPDDKKDKGFLAYGLTVSSLILYGRIVACGPECEKKYCYRLDDGTQSIEITYWKNDFENIRHLGNEIRALDVSYKPETVESLKRIFDKTVKQINMNTNLFGKKVFVQGKPTEYSNKIGVTANEIRCDLQTNNDTELAFKDMLIEWYLQKFNQCESSEITK